MRLLIAVALVLASVPGQASGLRGSIAEPIRDEPVLLIPAAGALEGANGTFFRSDVQISNLRDDAAQIVEIYWIPRGGSSGAPLRRVIEIPPMSGFASEDFVTDVLGVSGLGSVFLRGVLPGGEPDPLAEIHAVSRIWTPQPGTAGTTSQSFPVVPLRSTDERRLTIFGQRLDDRYRTNVGVVNSDPTAAHEFDIILTGVTVDGAAWGPVERRVSLPAWSMQQYPITGAPPLRILQIDVAPVLEADETPRPWIAYGSTVDNVTGDAWSHVGFATLEPLQQNHFQQSP